MAITTTVRMLLTRWSASTDAFTRTQLDQDHQDLEDRAAGALAGTFAARPAAAASLARFIYHATDRGEFYWCDGAAWVDLGGSVTDATRAAFLFGGY